MAESTQAAPFSEVLVATDFSPGASRAVARAARLPMKAGATLTILHVLPPGRPVDERERLAAAARRSLAEAAKAATRLARRARQPKIAIVSRLAEGHAVVEILRCAQQCRAELVVVGRHGERTFRDLLIGSTAERVIRRGARSVLVVSTPARTSYRRPLVAVDMSEPARHALRMARRLAESGATLTVLHAHSVPLEGHMRRVGVSDDQMQRYRAEFQRRAGVALEKFLAASSEAADGARRVLRRGDARRVILDEVEGEKTDLLVVGSHGRAGLAHLLLGSVAEAVVRRVSCDVLVARGPVARSKTSRRSR